MAIVTARAVAAARRRREKKVSYDRIRQRCEAWKEQQFELASTQYAALWEERMRSMTPQEMLDDGRGYYRSLPPGLDATELDRLHARAVARVRSGEIAMPRETRKHVYELANLIQARAREILRELTPQQIQGIKEEYGEIQDGE